MTESPSEQRTAGVSLGSNSSQATPIARVLPSVPSAASVGGSDSLAAKIESEFVHQVYNSIASHFSETRYKPWPIVDAFLQSLPVGSILGDIGCGNGKNLGVNPSVYGVGSDRSSGLMEICRQRGFESVVADNLSLPFRSGSFDSVISIAVIHHFTTERRRLDALSELVRIVRPGGRILVFVWALEQEKFGPENKEQDLLVPWQLRSVAEASSSSSSSSSSNSSNSSTPPVFQRYYHLFKKGELEELILRLPNVRVETSGYQRDNWYAVIVREH